MRTHITTAAALLAGALALTSCATTDTTSSAKPAASSSAPEISQADKAKARKAAGLPPEPNAATRTAYIAALDAIDPDIVHGKDDKAISRGLSQCSSYKTTKDRAKLVELTNFRFSSPTHPNGHGTAEAGKILDVVHKHLCPNF